MATRKFTAKTLPAGTTAKEVLAHVDNGDMTKAQAKAYLQARVDAKLAAGRRPTYATRQALVKLGGAEVDITSTQTRKQAAKARKAEAKPKAPAKAKRQPKAANVKPTVDDLVAQLAHDTEGVDAETQLAAFTRLVQGLMTK